MLGHGFGTGIEAHTVFAENMQVAEEGILVAGEGEVGGGDGDAHIDAYHAAVRQELELSG